MILREPPRNCPICHGLVWESRHEMVALAYEGMPYRVFVCVAGHTLQVGQPPTLRPNPRAPSHSIPFRCKGCRQEALGRAGQLYCDEECQRIARARPRRRSYTRGPSPPMPRPQGPPIPYASVRRKG